MKIERMTAILKNKWKKYFSARRTNPLALNLCSKVQVRLAENKWKKKFSTCFAQKQVEKYFFHLFFDICQFFRHSMAEKYEIAIIPR